jgi:hypothetical protein
MPATLVASVLSSSMKTSREQVVSTTLSAF